MLKRLSAFWRSISAAFTYESSEDGFVSVDQVAQSLGSLGGNIGQGLDSNVVMAPVQWLMRTFTQSPVIVETKRKGTWVQLEDHPLERLLAEPNDFYDGDAMAKAEVASYCVDGNAYLLKVRDELRTVRELWYVPHWLIKPRWPQDGSAFISHYEYKPSGHIGEPLRIPPRDVVHLRFGLDPRNPRLGMSPLKAVLREVLTDEEASSFSAYILANMGVPGGVISPADADARMSDDDVEDMKAIMADGFSGKKRGRWLVLGTPTKIEQFGFDPNRLMIGPLRDITEERVCAMLGIPAAVVGFGAGLQQTKVGATMRELVRLARVSCVEPMQGTIGRQLGRQLLPDFVTQPRRFRTVYDNSGISMFQEDETEVTKRAALLFEKKLAKRNEARAMVGLEPDEVEGDEYSGGSSSSVADVGGEGGAEGEGSEAIEGEPEPPAPPPPPTNRVHAMIDGPNGNGGGR